MREEYIITGVNRLTGKRDEISGSMPREEAERRLARELESRKRQRFQPYSHLRVERRAPVQLTIQFDEL